MIKYLYVLSSDASDNYLEQAFLSIISLKIYMPNSFVSILTDDVTEKTLIDKRKNILEYINELKVIEIDPQFKKRARSRWLKTSMRRHIQGDFLFIDCDTIICEDLSEIEKTNADLCAVFNAHNLLNEQYNRENIFYYDKILGHNSTLLSDRYFNSGVIFCRDVPACHSFFDEWHKLWLNGFSILLNDQPSFNQANYNLKNIIKELDGIWNCQIRTGGLAFLVNAKIIHYFATNNINDNPFTLADPSLLQNIKENGIIADNIIECLHHPKTCFYLHTQLLSNKKTIEIIFSRLFSIFCRFYNFKLTKMFVKIFKKSSYLNNKYINKRKYTKNIA